MEPQVTVSRYRHTRYWAVKDAQDQLICVCLYKRGALEAARRLNGPTDSTAPVLRDASPAWATETPDPRPSSPTIQSPYARC